MHISISLIALAVGYKVYVDALKEKEALKLLGQAIGVLVMIAALVGVGLGVARCVSKSGMCAMSKPFCPMASKGACPTRMAGTDSSAPSNP